MKNSIKETVFEAVADYLVARKAYKTTEECLEDLYTNTQDVIDSIVYLGLNGERNAETMYFCLMDVLD